MIMVQRCKHGYILVFSCINKPNQKEKASNRKWDLYGSAKVDSHLVASFMYKA